MSPKLRRFALINLVVLGLDQLSKAMARATWAPNTEGIDLIPGVLGLVHVVNPGAAGGLLGTHEHRLALLLGFTALATGLILSILRELPPGERPLSASLSFILAGTLGNAVDRLARGAVTDVLRLGRGGARVVAWPGGREPWSFDAPCVNLADLAIVGGVCAYLLLYATGYGPARGVPPKTP